MSRQKIRYGPEERRLRQQMGHVRLDQARAFWEASKAARALFASPAAFTAWLEGWGSWLHHTPRKRKKKRA